MKKNQEEINKELNELGATFGPSIGTPYVAPSGYFEDTKNALLKNVFVQDFIESLPKEMPQTIPAEYFNQMQAGVFAKIRSEQNKHRLFARPTVQKNWALAASIAAIITVGLFFVNTTPKTNQSLEVQLSTLSPEQIKGYLEEKSYDFEAMDILENPSITSKDLEYLESEIRDATKTLSDEEIFVYAL